MKAMIQTRYGSADVLRLAEVDRPAVPANGVLVRVKAASVHAGDWHLMRGTPFLIRFIYGGLRHPHIKILGCDVAGEVEAVGQEVTQFKPGDAVFGDLSEAGFGAFAEYVCAPATVFAPKPANLTFEEAATIPVSALTALQGLRDVGQLQAGQRVLVNGAAGGVGTFAVQIAKILGAEVTGLCSPHKVDTVRQLGADRSLSYDQGAPLLKEPEFDLILDTAAYRSMVDFLPALTPTGTYVMVGGSTLRFFQAMLLGPVLSTLYRRRVKVLVCTPNPTDLQSLSDWIEANQLHPHLDRTYPLSDLPDAIRALEQRQVQGKIAITMA